MFLRVRSAVLLSATLGGFMLGTARRSQTTMSSSTAKPPMSLCFTEAFTAKHEGRISEQEYYKYLTAHLGGIRHQDDDLNNKEVQEYLQYLSVFAASFRLFALNSHTVSIEDTPIYDQLLQQCSDGDFDATKASFAKLEANQSLPIPLQPLAVLATKQGHARILEFFLQKGAKFDEDLNYAVRQTEVDTGITEILWNRNWNDIQHSESMQNDFLIRAVHKSTEMVEFLLRKGVKVPDSIFKMPSMAEIPLSMMKTLVKERGIDPLKGTAVLTLAIRAGNREVVEYLCKMGLPLNEIPPELDPREAALCSPLYTAVQERDTEMMKLLLEHGADPHARYVKYRESSIIENVRERNEKELLSVLEKYDPTKPPSEKI